MAASNHISKIRWLTWARIAAASVVALAFAATMAVVLTAGLGPGGRVSLSITHGHFVSAGLLWTKRDLELFHVRKNRNETITYYTPADQVTVWVSMDAHGLTRRAANVCVDAVHVFDMPNAPSSFDGMVKIATIRNTVATGSGERPCKQWRRHNGTGPATMQLDRWITLDDDPLMLCYISQKYGSINDFTAMLEVEMEVLYDDPNESTTTNTSDIHYCWPVTIGNTRSTRAEAVTCKPSNGIDYTSNAPVLACDHLTSRQQFICNHWSQREICG